MKAFVKSIVIYKYDIDKIGCLRTSEVFQETFIVHPYVIIM